MKEILTAEKIAELTDDLNGIENIKAINKLYRQQDESNLWPVSGKFNLTERCFRKAREFQRASGAVYGLEYCYLIENIMSEIVNNSNL